MSATSLAKRIEEEQKKEDGDKDPIRSLVQRMQPQFEVALAGTINSEKFTRVALTAIRDNPKLQEATLPSLLAALMGAAQLGLEPHGPLEHCYLVPYGKEVKLIIGYKGLEQLAYRSGMVSSINARVVREGDVFDWEYGTNEFLTHKPKGGHGGEVTHAYAIARLVTGGTVWIVLFKEDIERARSRSATGKSDKSPWATDYDQMARKTAIRALFKDLPASTETQRALGYDEKVFVGSSDLDEPIDVEAVGDEEEEKV